MARKMVAVLVVFGVCGLVLPAMAKQEVAGQISDTPKILFLGTEIADKKPMGNTSFNPLVRLLNIPQAGSNEALKLSIENLPSGGSFYLYAALMMGRDYLVFNGVRVASGSLVAIPAPSGTWQAGTYTVKVIIATDQFWTVINDNLYQTVAISCCNGIEVEQFNITVKSPLPTCCSAPCPPPPPCFTCHKPCAPCGILGIILGILLLNQLCCP